ncbi:uncharacterized protein LOC105695435 [Orussus abietinus]|uniref:uncharacterized protein LOC105695435 n=1 Tax=Orussus abietinus TaxID=222816 RepID=UPI000C71610D|nr:uncharacterized protein LOC105695435 [Orussus abietinus]
MKKGTVALQTDVRTDEDWEEVLERPGLVVVDVYSEWSGPCAAMVSTLRKVKMEQGGEILSFAIARNDDISALERFRGKSEPVWMFIQNGKMVNSMFGAHCPNMQRLLVEEIRRVQQGEPSRWAIPVTQRGPEEEVRWQAKEAIRKAQEDAQLALEEAEKRTKYEAFLAQMTFELCEETAVLLYPWIFLDEEGNQKDKNACPAYTELVNELLKEYYDVAESVSFQLDEETIEKMFVESDVEITEELVEGLTSGKCLIMRLKGKPPHPSWPVPYPNECPEEIGKENCPVRAINDVENYLLEILNNGPQPPPSWSEDQTPPPKPEGGPYVSRHFYLHEPDPEVEEDVEKIYPAVWAPPQARSKVHVFKTIFSGYMDKSHPYFEPVPPLPLCAFKFDASKLQAVSDAFIAHQLAIECFGVFEFDRPPLARRIASTPQNFEAKARHKTGGEVFVVIIRRVNEEAFLAFAGIEPYFVTEDTEEAEKMIEQYFPEGVVDATLEEPVVDGEEEESFEEEEEDVEEGEDEEEQENEGEAFFDDDF